MSFVVGLTGGIGSGKSTVADLFAKHGAGIIDTDVIAHHLTQAGGIAIPSIRATFGSDYVTNEGALDRTKMRGLIFSDVAAKQQLEMILHPLILEQTKTQMRQMQALPYLIAVVPLLLGNPEFQKLAQCVLVVDCAEERQIERVIKRNGMTAREVRTIIEQQTPRAERLQLADDVIHNDGGLDDLSAQVTVLHKRYLDARNGI